MNENEVGTHAGDVYFLLSKKGKMSLRKIGECTKRKESVIYLSLGWLLRENKINIIELEGEFFYELKDCLSNIYY